MTHVITLRIEVAADDTVQMRDLRAILTDTLREMGTVEVHSDFGAPGRVHWGSVEIKQGPEQLSPKAARVRRLRTSVEQPRLVE